MDLKTAVLAMLLVGLCLVPSERASSGEISATTTTSVYELRTYLSNGQKVGGDDRAFIWGYMSYQGLNDSAVLACYAGFQSVSGLGTKGVYLWDGSALTIVSELPATDNFTGHFNPAINSRGDVVYTWYELIDQSVRTMLTARVDGVRTDLVAVGEEIVPGFDVKVLPAAPTVNTQGEIAVLVNTGHPNGGDTYTIYKYTGSRFVRVIGQGNDAPGGGRFLMNYGPIPRVWLADNGDILFKAYVLGGTYDQMDGLFVVRADGTVEKVEIRGDPLPVGGEVHFYSLGEGSLNPIGDAAFRVRIDHPSISSGVFVSSHGALSPVMYDGQPSPLGGPFLSFYHPSEDDPSGAGSFDADPPLINSRGQVLFKAEARDREGVKRFGLFLGTPNCIVKVVAEGDRLPTGNQLLEIAEYSLNEQGQVAFRVRERTPEGRPYGIFLATPTPSEITSVKVKGTDDTKRLVIKGSGFVINDAIVEIDGHVVGGVEYSAASSGNDGTTRRLIVRGSELSDLLQPGQTVQITVSSPFTGLRSAPFSLSVPNR